MSNSTVSSKSISQKIGNESREVKSSGRDQEIKVSSIDLSSNKTGGADDKGRTTEMSRNKTLEVSGNNCQEIKLSSKMMSGSKISRSDSKTGEESMDKNSEMSGNKCQEIKLSSTVLSGSKISRSDDKI